MTIAELQTTIETAKYHRDMEGIHGLEIDKHAEGSILQVQLRTIISEIKKSDDSRQILYVFFEKGDLFFTSKMQAYKPLDGLLAFFLQANAYTRYGGFRWDNSDGEVSYKYRLPLPSDPARYLTPYLVGAILRDIYYALLFLEGQLLMFPMMDGPISKEDMNAKREQITKIRTRLVGTKEEVNGRW